MTEDQLRKLRGMSTYKIPVSQRSRPVTLNSGLPAGWRIAKGDSEDQDEDEEEEEEEEDEDTDEEEEEIPAKVEDSDDEGSSEAEESSGEEESSDNTEEGPAASDPEESSRAEADQRETLVSFGGTMHDSDYVPTKDNNDSFRSGTDGTQRKKRWESLDPNAKDPPKTQGTEVVTSNSDRGSISVAVLEGGRKGFVKKKRS